MSSRIQDYLAEKSKRNRRNILGSGVFVAKA